VIVTVDEIKSRTEIENLNDEQIKWRLESIEAVIRKYTHNNFHKISARFEAATTDAEILGTSPYIKPGDTVQITQSGINDDIYVVETVTKTGMTVDKPIFENPFNRITKIVYPADVVQCAIDMFDWKLKYGDKVGIKSESETLSRHTESVTYEDSTALYMGYPKGLLSTLSLHVKARGWK
jgi:hypothetical protein